MLVAFEGQDGAGKTALLEAVKSGLDDLRIATAAIGEFSDSPYGQRLTEALARDKFLRPAANEPATCRTRALEEVTDLYYLDECVIRPALMRGQVVLKDRHLDTVLYTQVPVLAGMGAFANDEDALAWLNGTLSALRHPPDLTVYVCAPLTVCLERIAKRTPHLAEHRANEVNDDDRDMFAARQRIMRRLIADASNQYMSVDNSNSRIERGAHEVIRAICERLTRSEG